VRREGPDRRGLLAAFVEAHRELIAYARCVCAQGVADAEDIVQEAFLRVWTHRDRWRLGSGGWYLLATRSALNGSEIIRCDVAGREA
jgi:DNA-directed RNA polymerase specialized sigma24 family protein